MLSPMQAVPIEIGQQLAERIRDLEPLLFVARVVEASWIIGRNRPDNPDSRSAH